MRVHEVEVLSDAPVPRGYSDRRSEIGDRNVRFRNASQPVRVRWIHVRRRSDPCRRFTDRTTPFGEGMADVGRRSVVIVEGPDGCAGELCACRLPNRRRL